MKTMRTVLAAVLLIVGFSYVTHAYPPTLGTVSQCCGPQPEDLRVYRVVFTDPGGLEPIVIIPTVEGPNGFVITHVRFNSNGSTIYEDVGEGPEEILLVGSSTLLNPTMQFPLVAGSTIMASGTEGAWVTIIGYVY